MTDSLGVEIGPGRFRALAASGPPPGRRPIRRRVEAWPRWTRVAEVGEPLLHRVLRPRWPASSAVVPARRRRCREASRRRPAGGPGPGPAPRPTPRARPEGGGRGRVRESRAAARAGRRPFGDPAAPTRGRCALAIGRVGRLVDALRRAERESGDDRRQRDPLPAGPGPAGRRPPGRRPGQARRRSTDDEVAWVDGGSRFAEPAGVPHRGRAAAGRAPVGRGDRRPDLGHGPARAARTGSAFRPSAPTSSMWAARSTTAYHAMLYVARSLPDRRRPESEPAIHDELERPDRPRPAGAPSPCSPAGGP